MPRRSTVLVVAVLCCCCLAFGSCTRTRWASGALERLRTEITSAEAELAGLRAEAELRSHFAAALDDRRPEPESSGKPKNGAGRRSLLVWVYCNFQLLNQKRCRAACHVCSSLTLPTINIDLSKMQAASGRAHVPLPLIMLPYGFLGANVDEPSSFQRKWWQRKVHSALIQKVLFNRWRSSVNLFEHFHRRHPTESSPYSMDCI